MIYTPSERGQRVNTRLILVMRGLRSLAYGLLAVLLGVALTDEGFLAVAIGILITMSLIGDMVGTYVICLVADTWGWRRVLAQLMPWVYVSYSGCRQYSHSLWQGCRFDSHPMSRHHDKATYRRKGYGSDLCRNLGIHAVLCGDSRRFLAWMRWLEDWWCRV